MLSVLIMCLRKMARSVCGTVCSLECDSLNSSEGWLLPMLWSQDWWKYKLKLLRYKWGPNSSKWALFYCLWLWIRFHHLPRNSKSEGRGWWLLHKCAKSQSWSEECSITVIYCICVMPCRCDLKRASKSMFLFIIIVSMICWSFKLCILREPMHRLHTPTS